jgi:hypothetical protein
MNLLLHALAGAMVNCTVSTQQASMDLVPVASKKQDQLPTVCVTHSAKVSSEVTEQVLFKSCPSHKQNQPCQISSNASDQSWNRSKYASSSYHVNFFYLILEHTSQHPIIHSRPLLLATGILSALKTS